MVNDGEMTMIFEPTIAELLDTHFGIFGYNEFSGGVYLEVGKMTRILTHEEMRGCSQPYETSDVVRELMWQLCLDQEKQP